jgi:glycerophosphoryl diester phosphodiesterase
MSKALNAMQTLFGGRRRPFLMAHRGNRALHPENTLASFRCAVRDGADILETDVHLSADGEFICIHDATVDRTTNGSGAVAEMTVKEIKALRALDPAGNPTEERIPTLAEVAAALPEKVALALELKTDRFLEADVCRRFADALREGGIFPRSFALSFSLPRLRALQQAAEEMPIGWITMSRVLPDRDVELIGPFWPLVYLNPLYVARAHRQGMFVCPLDPKPERRLRHYLNLGCDAVISDNPAVTRAAMDRLMGGASGRVRLE